MTDEMSEIRDGPPFHKLRVQEVFQVLNTSPQGLAANKAQERLHQFGPTIFVLLPKSLST